MEPSSDWLQHPINEIKRWLNDNPYYGERLRGYLRLLFALFIIDIFGLFGMIVFQSADPLRLAGDLHNQHLLYRFVPPLLIIPLTPLTSPDFFRYMVPPIAVIVFLLVAGSLYVQDIYNLDDFRPAFQHVISSMFGLFYPKIRIDGAEIRKKTAEINPLEVIGGPGFALIQPGNAVTFRLLRRPSRASLTGAYFLRPFETIGQIVSLDDQHGFQESMDAVTLDGIRVHLRDVHFRYRILPKEGEVSKVLRTLENPYPFSEDAMINMAINLPVDDKGNVSWTGAIQRTVTGAIGGYISSHTIDQITAPRASNLDPRREIKGELFAKSIQNSLRNLGAELLWIDIGHIDIQEESVDQSRLDLWASRWIGDANRAIAYGEGKRLVYQELGRAEAQADMIMSILDAFEEMDLSHNPMDNIRQMLLVRTTQILEAMSENKEPVKK